MSINILRYLYTLSVILLPFTYVSIPLDFKFFLNQEFIVYLDIFSMFILIIMIFELNTIWSFKQILSPKMLKKKPIILIFAFFMITSFIGIFFSNHILEGLRRFIRFSLFCLYCILFSKFLSKDQKNKSLFLDTLIVLSIFLTSLAFLEYFGVFTDFFNIFRNNTSTIIDNRRVSSLFNDPNYYASFSVFVFYVIIQKLFKDDVDLNKFKLIGYSIFLFGLLITILLSFSRTSWISMVFSFLIILYLFSKNNQSFQIKNLKSLISTNFKYLIIIFTPLIFILFFLIGDVIIFRITTLLDLRGASIEERMILFEMGFQMFMDNPIMGVGWGNFPFRLEEYLRDLTLPSGRTNVVPHSIYLEILSETGLLGFSLFLAMVFSLLKLPNDNQGSNYSQNIMFGAFISLLISGIFLGILYQSFFWVCLSYQLSKSYQTGTVI